MLKNSFKLSLAIIFFFAACNCDDTTKLSTICPQTFSCEIIDGQIVDVTNKKFVGQCKPGKSSCSSGNVVDQCLDIIKPTEESCDGLDNDCDYVIDEPFDQDNDGFSTCSGDCNDFDVNINPHTTEQCDNIDNNCDGKVDEFFVTCWTGPQQIVFGDSVCKLGEMYCNNGVWSECRNQVLPTIETCDQLDNDCDGFIDEREEHNCGYADIGACKLGDTVCVPEENEQLCINAVLPQQETCNAVDDNCDGSVDEGLVRLCESTCSTGIESCVNGQWLNCTASQPMKELCDGVDNNCDNEVDEDCECIANDTQVCRRNVISPTSNLPTNCGFGFSVCDEQGEWGPCYYVNSENERCDNWDNDCDSVIDGISATCGDPTLAGIGQCRLGESICELGIWSVCRNEIVPRPELCNQLDDDCDGIVDEDLVPHDKVDICFFIDGSGSMCPVMQAIANGIGAYANDFRNTQHRFCLGVFPGVVPTANSPGVPVIMLTGVPGNALVDIDQFQLAISNLDCNYGGLEPNYDVMYLASDPTDPLGIGWRGIATTTVPAYPYIIMVTDEDQQTWLNLSEAQIAQHTQNCTVGSCLPGDPYEVYLFTRTQFYGFWDSILLNDSSRFIDIFPSNSTRYTDILRNIFTNVCF